MQKADNLMGLFHLEKVVSGKNLTTSSSPLPPNHQSHAEVNVAKLRGKRALKYPCPITLRGKNICSDSECVHSVAHLYINILFSITSIEEILGVIINYDNMHIYIQYVHCI